MSNVNTTSDPAREVTQHLRSLESRGSHRLVAQLIDSMMGESSAQLQAVRKALSTGDRDALYRSAHSLQGSVSIVGADSVARACGELVKKSRGSTFEELEPIFAEVETGIEAIRKALVGWTEKTGVEAGRVLSAEPDERSTRSVPSPKRVLVIDDDDEIRKITQMLVEGLGHHVEAARDGAEGLEKLQTGVDLILLDVVMPGLDGFEVCRRIRQDPAGKDVPVIFVTTLGTREHRLHAVEAGANDFIAKPVDETELRIRSASLLKMKEAQDEVRRYQTHLEDMIVERTSSLREALEQMARAQRLAYQAQLETVERLAMLAEYKDKVTGRHIQRMSEYLCRDRARIAAAARRSGADLPCQPDARRRQDRRAGGDPQKAVQPRAGGVAPDAPALGARQRHSGQLDVRDSSGRPRDGASSSRALGRRRLSAGSGWRRDPALGANLRRRRCLRRGHKRAAIQACLSQRRGVTVTARRPRQTLRSAGRRRLLRMSGRNPRHTGEIQRRITDKSPKLLSLVQIVEGR